MDQVDLESIAVGVLSTFVALLIVNLGFPGITSLAGRFALEEAIQFPELYFWTYLGILIVVGFAFYVIIRFRKHLSVGDMLGVLLKALLLTIIATGYISLVIIAFSGDAEIQAYLNGISPIERITLRIFQYPAIVAIYIASPFAVWTFYVIFFNVMYYLGIRMDVRAK